MIIRLIFLLLAIVATVYYVRMEGFVNTVDPCAGLTDASPASSISNACLQKMFLEAGCSKSGTAYPADTGVMWWNSSPQGTTPIGCGAPGTATAWPNCGAGNVGNTKRDMKAWATLMDDARVKGCRGPQCRGVTTPLDADGGGNAIYLDRQRLICNADESISGFRLIRGGPNNTQYQYEYICCKNPVGPAGPAGAQGPVGANGKDGAQGLAGAQGPIGLTGKDGKMGPMGPMGPQGPQGPQGPVGSFDPNGPISASANVTGSSDSELLQSIQQIIRSEFQTNL